MKARLRLLIAERQASFYRLQLLLDRQRTFIRTKRSVLSSDWRLAAATISRLEPSDDTSANIFPEIPPSWLKT